MRNMAAQKEETRSDGAAAVRSTRILYTHTHRTVMTCVIIIQHPSSQQPIRIIIIFYD